MEILKVSFYTSLVWCSRDMNNTDTNATIHLSQIKQYVPFLN